MCESNKINGLKRERKNRNDFHLSCIFLSWSCAGWAVLVLVVLVILRGEGPGYFWMFLEDRHLFNLME